MSDELRCPYCRVEIDRCEIVGEYPGDVNPEGVFDMECPCCHKTVSVWPTLLFSVHKINA